MKRLAKKVVVVTGSTQGCGAQVARQIAQEGAHGVIICGRSKENGLLLEKELIGETDTKVKFVPCDLLLEEDARGVVKTAVSEFGRLDGLVNSAAGCSRGTWYSGFPGHETQSAECADNFLKLFKLNTLAPFFTMQEAITVMRHQPEGGSIVNISSMSGYGGQPFLVGYASTKAALNALTKNAANANRHHKIRVNGLALGWMKTPGEDATQAEFHGQGADWADAADAMMPFGRILRPHDVSALCSHLLSDDAYLQTGSIIDLGVQSVVFGALD